MPLEAEAHESTAPGNADKIEVMVKSSIGVDLTFDGKTESTGEAPNHTFLLPKSKLKLGTNMLAVGATRANFGSKSVATANVKIEVGPKMVLHVQGASGAVNEGTFVCAGPMCGATSIPFSKAGKLALEITSDVAAKLTVEGKTVQLAAGAKSPVDVDLVAKLAQTSVTQNEDVLLPLTLEADGAKLTENLILRGTAMNELAARELAKAAAGPVLFPGEKPSADALLPNPPASLIVTGAPSSPLIVVGKPKTFGDVELVAVGKQSERKFACPNGTILYIDLDVTVVERRTGKSVGQKTISADRTSCPPIATTQPLKSTVREDDTRKVLTEAFLTKK